MAGSIEIAGLGKTYREPVLDRLDLTIGGGVFALLGPNGAGKTTLVSILTTLILPSTGSAHILGVDVVREPGSVRQVIAATGQNTTLDEYLTGRENLVMFGRLRGLGRRSRGRAEELLAQFGLEQAGPRLVSTYSGGMRRRLDLAASLVTQPAVLFLDEPTTGLDPVARRSVWSDVRRLADDGTTVFLTTQTLDEAEALADRIAVLRAGRIVADGTVEELTATVGGQRLVLLDHDGTEVRSIDTDGTAASLDAALGAVPDAERALRATLRSPTLDDAFVALTQSAPDHQEAVA